MRGAAIPGPVKAGYFGKVPTQGDFVFRGLPLALTDRLDGWLRQSVRDSQNRMGRDWLPAFLVAPVWRMAITPGLFGPDALIGVMMPSVDRAGRYFPLVIAAPVPGLRASAADLARMATWFDAAEELALSTLDPRFSLSWFDEQIARLELPASVLPPDDPQAEAGSLWWTGAGEGAQMALEHMPPPDAFGALFLATRSGAGQGLPAPSPVRNPLEIGIGKAVRKSSRQLVPPDQIVVNRDAQAVTLLNGIGAVKNPAHTVQVAADTFRGIDDPLSMNDLIAGAKGRIGTANSLLRAGVGQADPPCVSFAMLLMQGHLFAILWAGNTRAYLLRDGTLSLLTRDHTDRRLPSVLTRALGIGQQLSPDQSGGELLAQDRFLLCSGSITQALSDEEIASTLANARTPDSAAETLTQNALIAGTTASVSAAAVFVSEKA
ncbi:MAG: type VI secretion system-associated protein TagF [Paracoccus sp. (in: a-proteobacteria)]|uniref:type VI secretion system-associated protein TagF n=1 Tax=Paracoccus sp. TaxID=267 RepID=UPI0026E00670|nr:type VI secretion system-associated protein TagF [Paracoccus sp. (in: a-proteobacteria)]MDO5611865.1 type VI secretion system-associated protein TagF [Paracoccus sp. (in: a-proteobacteria)]